LTGQTDPIDLGLQLGITAGLVFAMIVSHTLGLGGISRILKLEDRSLHPLAFDLKMLFLISTMGFLIVTLHVLEIVLYAIVYVAAGPMPTFEDALYHSATAYSTLGVSDGTFPRDWRLVGATEGLLGFVLIGWSTAYMVSAMQRIRT
jgi:hypothetical protein